jgi:hypothetical protein
MKNLSRRKPVYITKGFASLEDYLGFLRKSFDVKTGFLFTTQESKGERIIYEKTKESSN